MLTNNKNIPNPRSRKLLIGWRENVSLPEFGLGTLKAKIDTGARTTALHASNITEYKVGGETWVEFVPDHGEEVVDTVCKARVLHIKSITNTSGIPEDRFIIATSLRIAELEHRIEISLTDRSEMKFPVILGRTALRLLRLNVNPSRSWLLTKNKKKRKKD